MKIRPRIGIPTYDNDLTISRVVVDCLEQTELPVLVIDDGSKAPVRDLLAAHPVASRYLGGRLHTLRLEKNRGKGVALRAAFQDSVRQEFTHLVTLDGDGQHRAADIPALVEESRKNPWDLVIGVRNLERSGAPELSRLGRAFSNFWVRYQTGNLIHDSQSGFRVYPLFHVQNSRFLCRRYDFEIEVLIRLIWKGVEVREREIEVFYPPPDQRVSHFAKWRDNFRISLLNTVLVAVSLFREHLSPSRAALALGVGVFVGCTPFFGLHIPFVLGLSLLLRLNAGLLILGTQVSLPPFAPFLAWASIRVGAVMAEGTGPWLLFGQWLLGSLFVGSALGTMAALLMLVARSRNRPQRNWTGKTRGGRFGNWFVGLILRRLGRRAGYACLYFIVPYFYFFAPRATLASLEYWRVLDGKMSFWRCHARVLWHYYRFGTLLMDRYLQDHSPDPVFHSVPHGFEEITGPVRGGRGLIIVSAHLGSWDVAARYMTFDGMEKAFHQVRHEDPGATLPIFKIHDMLAAGKPVGIMADRPVSRHFELVPFLGKLAAFDITAFRVAAATGTPLVFSFGLKGEGDRYEFFATPARVYRYESGQDREEQLLTWVREYVVTLESFVHRYQDQWFNFFRFWSSPPALHTM